MDIPVFVTPHPSGFQARMGSPFDHAAEGPTADTALAALRAQLAAKIHGGCSVRSIQINDVDSIQAAALKLGQSPLFEEWEKEVAEYRRLYNTVPDAD